MTGLRALSALAILGCGVIAFAAVRRLGAGDGVALVTTALVLFVPVAQMAAVMIGNEPLAALLVAATLLCLLALQEDPRRPGLAAFAGLLGGLALATKYTAVLAAVTCAVPFLRLDLGRRGYRALAVCLVTGVAVAAPVYVRNLALEGTPVPMTRTLEPMRGVESAYVLGPRAVTDYLLVPPACLLRPSIIHLAEGPPRAGEWNRAMQSVWGLAYASMWYDAFSHRVPIRFHQDGVRAGPLLALLGLVPTGLVLLGFAAALADLARRRGRSSDAPLTVLAALNGLTFVGYTWSAPAMVAAKASYLLPSLLPAAAFFARGVRMLPRGAAAPALVLSALAAVAAAVGFTTGVVFPPDDGPRFLRGWEITGGYLPGARIEDAVRHVDPYLRRGAGRSP
jgi:hypothetical protein